jgi:phage terminase large subunit-like protein
MIATDPLPAEDFATDGHRAIRFIEQFCRLTNGPLAGTLIRLRPWQRAEILELFRLGDDGKRVYRRGLWGRPRKGSKTLEAACLALYALLGDGEIGAEVYVVAGDRDQARICFDMAVQIVRLDPDLSDACVIRDAQAMILHKPSGSVFRALAADHATAEGYNPSFVVFDEVHVQPNSKLWAVMVNGSATRERACVLGITTAGYDLDSLCGKLYKMGKAGDVWCTEPVSEDGLGHRQAPQAVALSTHRRFYDSRCPPALRRISNWRASDGGGTPVLHGAGCPQEERGGLRAADSG